VPVCEIGAGKGEDARCVPLQASRHERLSRQGWSTGAWYLLRVMYTGIRFGLGGQSSPVEARGARGSGIQARREICLCYYYRFRVGGL
jgi:hypothetical protein